LEIVLIILKLLSESSTIITVQLLWIISDRVWVCK